MRKLISMQRNELTEALVYEGIAAHLTDEHNKSVLIKCAQEERKHAGIWESITGSSVRPDKFRAAVLVLLARMLGFTFVLKLMENGESAAAGAYSQLCSEVPEAAAISEDEKKHESELLEMLDEERLKYVGSMVLGLSDALVELTGTLAGLTLALQDTRLVALSGLVTGISASLSMASGEYLSAKAEGGKDAFKSCLHTGGIYIITVAVLVAPYLIMPRSMAFAALAVMLFFVLLIITAFTWYISVARNLSFKKRFREMTVISFSVAAVSFGIGYVVSELLGVEV